ncbi:MAG TPA: hypothetical protein VK207_06255, partial [Bacteroidales bacterium]|nr:hypothetical protein [Bacteroidales bacterium]
MVTFNGTSNNGSFNPSVAGFQLENASFTAGAAACFAGSPTHFYTKANGDWVTASNWDVNFIGSGIHAVPTAGSIVHIYNDISTPDN